MTYVPQIASNEYHTNLVNTSTIVYQRSSVIILATTQQ